MTPLRFLYDDTPRLVAWAKDRMPGFGTKPEAVVIGAERGGEIVAVAVFDTFSPRDCHVHIVSDGKKRWLSREYIIRLLAYPFLQCGFTRISAEISERNEASLVMAEKFGFKEEGRRRQAGPEGEDLILFGLLRSECRWASRLARKPDIAYKKTASA